MIGHGENVQHLDSQWGKSINLQGKAMLFSNKFSNKFSKSLNHFIAVAWWNGVGHSGRRASEARNNTLTSAGYSLILHPSIRLLALLMEVRPTH